MYALTSDPVQLLRSSSSFQLTTLFVEFVHYDCRRFLVRDSFVRTVISVIVPIQLTETLLIQFCVGE